MRRFWWIFVLLLVLRPGATWGAVSGPPAATFGNTTLEAMTIEARVIVRGRLVSASFDGRDEWTVRVEPVEIMKGPGAVGVVETFRFWKWGRHPKWPAKGSMVLVFSGATREVMEIVSLENAAPVLVPGSVRDIDFNVVRDEKRLMSIVRAELARGPTATTEILGLDSPFEYLEVPADERLLPAAREWVHSDSPHARCAAARAFGNHPDPVDTRLLYALLADPFTAENPYMISPWSGHEYIVRQEAVRALLARGAVVPPVRLFERRTDLYQEISWASLAGFLVVPLLYAVGRWGAGRYFRWKRLTWSGRLVSGLTFVSVYLAVLTLGMIVRGGHTADNIVYARSGWMVDMVLAHGELDFDLSTHWPEETSLVNVAWDARKMPNFGAKVESFRSGFAGGEWGMLNAGRWEQKWSWAMGFNGSERLNTYPDGWRTGRRPFMVNGAAGVISLAYFLLLFSLVPAWRVGLWGFRRARKLRRVRANHCAECGYDLRGHGGAGRCPECGFETGSSALHCNAVETEMLEPPLTLRVPLYEAMML